MKIGTRTIVFILGAAAIATVARGGHELPIYPSFYPHEIEIKSLAPEPAAQALRAGKIQAYVGPGLGFAGAPPPEIGTIESLGSFVVVRVNPASARATDEASACAVVKAVMRELAAQGDVVLHPYPVTPFHGDYLHHADLAAAAKTRFCRRRWASRRPQGAGARPARTTPSALVRGRSRLGCRGRRGRRGRTRGLRDIRGERLVRAALGEDRLVPCRASARRCRERTRPRTTRLDRSAAPRERRFHRARGAYQSGARPGRRAHRRLPQDRRRLHGEAGIRQRRVLGRDREHRLRCRSRACIRRSSSAR